MYSSAINGIKCRKTFNIDVSATRENTEFRLSTNTFVVKIMEYVLGHTRIAVL